MADDVTLPGTGAVIAAEEISSKKYQLIKLLSGKATSLEPAPLLFPFDITVDITRPADTTQYAANDALSNSTSAPTSDGFTLSNICRKSGGYCIITDAIMVTDNDAATPLQCEVFLFNQAVTNINDNGAFTITDAEAKTCVGKIGFALEDIGGNGFFHAQNLNIVAGAVGTANLRFLVRVKNTYTPASGEVISLRVKGYAAD